MMQSCPAEDNYSLLKKSFDAEKKMISQLAAFQYGDGSFTQSYRLGGVDLFPLWFIYLATDYIKETGRFEILDETLPFKGRSFRMHFSEKSGSVEYEPGGSPLYYHLEYAFDAFCKQLMSCSAGIPENIIAAGLFSYIGKDFVKLCRCSDMYFGASLAVRKFRQVASAIGPAFSDKKQITGVLDFLKQHECRCCKGPNCRKCYCEDIRGFIRSFMLGIVGLFSREYAYEYWYGNCSEWSPKVVSEWIMGIKAGFDGLYVDPCIFGKYPGCEVYRYYRNAIYRIFIKNTSPSPLEVRKLIVDHTEYLGNLLPVFSDGNTHDVEVITDL